MDLTGFSSLDLCAAIVPAGTGKLEYAPLDGIDTDSYEPAVISSTYNQQRAITFDGGQWFTLPFAPGTGQWTEDEQAADQGDYFRISVNALLPADSSTVRGELDRMRRHRYLLRLTRDGQVILIGTPEQPLAFTSRFDSGAQGGDTRGHRAEFSGVSIRKSPGYVPVF